MILPPLTAPEALTLVNPPAAGVTAPITVPLIVPPDIVRSSATYVSATAVPCQTPPVTVPTVSMAVLFPVVRNVPLTSGSVRTRSAVGFATAIFVSLGSATRPSKIRGASPVNMPNSVADTPVRPVPSPLKEPVKSLAATVPEAVILRRPEISLLLSTISALLPDTVPAVIPSNTFTSVADSVVVPSSNDKEPPVTAPEAVIVVAPVSAPLVSVAVPSVKLPPVTAPEAFIVVAPDSAPPVSVAVPSVKLPLVNAPEAVNELTPVTTPASTLTAPSNTIAEPSAGVRLIAPVAVLIVTAASPAVISSDLIALADTPVIPEPSPVKVVAATVPSTVTVPFDKVIKFGSSV